MSDKEILHSKPTLPVQTQCKCANKGNCKSVAANKTKNIKFISKIKS